MMRSLTIGKYPNLLQIWPWPVLCFRKKWIGVSMAFGEIGNSGVAELRGYRVDLWKRHFYISRHRFRITRSYPTA